LNFCLKKYFKHFLKFKNSWSFLSLFSPIKSSRKKCLKFQIFKTDPRKKSLLFCFTRFLLINGFICTTCITVSNAINIFLKDILLPQPSGFFFSASEFHAKHIKKKSRRKNLFTFKRFY
jgi:hypothetical protein